MIALALPPADWAAAVLAAFAGGTAVSCLLWRVLVTR